MKHKIQDFHFITCLQFTVQTFRHPIAAASKIAQPEHPVWKISDFDVGACLQISRADFTLRSIKVGIALILNLG